MPTRTNTSSPEIRDGLDYDAADTLVVSDPAQLRALAHDVRSGIVSLLRERAHSTQQLSAELGIPKGTVGHHLKVLERAGLVHVVRTRRVRAVTERFYGRTARLFLVQTEDPASERAFGAAVLRQAASEVERSSRGTGFGLAKANLAEKDARRLERRLKKLTDDFLAADSPEGAPYALVGGLYARPDA